MREELLGDIREAFRKRAGERIFTEELLAELRAREDRPWGEWRRGQAMSAAQLARQLRPFGVRHRLYREAAKCGRGYSAEDFADAFARYLPATRYRRYKSMRARVGLQRRSVTPRLSQRLGKAAQTQAGRALSRM